MRPLRIKIVDHSGLANKHWDKRVERVKERIEKVNPDFKVSFDIFPEEFKEVKLLAPYAHESMRDGRMLKYRLPNRQWMTETYAVFATDYDVVVANFSTPQVLAVGDNDLGGESVRNVLGVSEIFMHSTGIRHWTDLFLHELSHSVFDHIMGRPGLDPTHYWDYQMNHLDGAIKLWQLPDALVKSPAQLTLAVMYLQLKILVLKVLGLQKESAPEIVLPPKDKEERRENHLKNWANAIKEFEGWFPGSRSQRNNNPGNLRYSRYQNGTDGGYSTFKTYEEGWKGLLFQLKIATDGRSRVYNPEMSLLEFFEKYAPSSDNNHPKTYATFVAKKLGTNLETKIKDLV